MKVLLLLCLVLGTTGMARAQEGPPVTTYTDPLGYYHLNIPYTWALRAAGGTLAFVPVAGGAAGPTVVLTETALPPAQANQTLATQRVQDSVWRNIRRLPRAQTLWLSQREGSRFNELRYEYTYAVPPPNSPVRAHVLGRVLRRGGTEYRLEYRSRSDHDAPYVAAAQELLASFVFTDKPFVSRRYDEQTCDNKFYGIAALRTANGQQLDDCRSLDEFTGANLTGTPVVHRSVLPFQSYAITKGFDNALYAVTKAPTNQPEQVFRYDPATHKGNYMPWTLPAQGEDLNWISAATDEAGDLYFITSDANQLVKVSPRTGTVRPVWTTDPLRKAPFFAAINQPGKNGARPGSHANFCLDDSGTMYLVNSSDGSIMKIDLKSRRPYPDLTPLEGLPRRGGYSGLQMQNDAQGRRRLYLAGPHALYIVDMAKRRATRVRAGTYTDLAGCNLFQVPPPADKAPPPPTTTLWQGRVLNADTFEPLPEAQLRLGPAELPTLVFLTSRGNFSFRAKAGDSYSCYAQLPGYAATDSAWTAEPGPVVRDVLLQPLGVGTIHRLSAVQFEQGRPALLPAAGPALDQLVALLKDNPGLKIELRGHTDNVGPPEKNLALSQQRVQTVKNYLVVHGIAPIRITGTGFGGEQPIAPNETEETRRLNRRVEFRVTGLE